MNYIESLRAEIASRMPNNDPLLVEFYTLLGIIFGSAVNEEDVHNAWAVHQNGINPNHRSLIPFDDLTPEVQALGTEYVEIIRDSVKASHG